MITIEESKRRNTLVVKKDKKILFTEKYEPDIDYVGDEIIPEEVIDDLVNELRYKFPDEKIEYYGEIFESKNEIEKEEKEQKIKRKKKEKDVDIILELSSAKNEQIKIRIGEITRIINLSVYNRRKNISISIDGGQLSYIDFTDTDKEKSYNKLIMTLYGKGKSGKLLYKNIESSYNVNVKNIFTRGNLSKELFNQL